MRTRFELVRKTFESTPSIPKSQLLALPALAGMTSHIARSTVYKWTRAELLVCDGDNYSLGPRAVDERKRLCEKRRCGPDDVPTERPENDTWILWMRSGEVETFNTTDVMWWLDLSTKSEAGDVIRANILGGWLRVVKPGRDALYARWDRGIEASA